MANRTMKAVIFHAPGDIRLESVEIPVLKAGEILLKVERALTCGTDFKAYRQGHPVLFNHRLPSPFGHEVAGTVAECGAGVSAWKIGDRIVAANSAPCDRCFFCAQGTPNLCDNLFLLNGAYAQYLVVPTQIAKHNVYKIPAQVDFATAALSEPVACVARAVDRMNLLPGQRLAILGCGLMGGIFVQLAKARNIHVTAIGRSREKIEEAKSFGADETLSILDEKDPVAAARALTPDGRGFDAVVEAVGKPHSWQQAVALARRGGTICFYGGCAQGETVALDTHRIHYEELKLLGVFHHSPTHFREAFEALCAGKIGAKRMIHGEITLDQVPAHFAKRVSEPFLKTAVIP